VVLSAILSLSDIKQKGLLRQMQEEEGKFLDF